MFIKHITGQHRNDFSAIMKCEHCGAECKITTGYNDDYYHEVVIPNMICPSCSKDRKGES